MNPNLATQTSVRSASIKALMSGCAILLAPFGGAAWAQQAAVPSTSITIPEIVVEGGATGVVPSESELGDDRDFYVATEATSGSRLPTDLMDTAASVSVITAKEIERRGATTTEEVLQYTPGVQTDFYGSDDRFDFFKIRGFDATTYRDGLLIGDAFGGAREEPFAYERMEVLKGANSTGFGVSDPGGAINYVSKRPTGERIRNVYGTLGLQDHKEVGVDLGDSFDEAGVLSWRLTGKVQDADGETDHSQNNIGFIMGGLGWRPSENTSASIVFDHLNRDAVPGSGGYPVGIDFDRDDFFGEPDFNYRGTDRSTVTAKFDHAFNEALSFNSTARYSKSQADFGYAYISGIQSLANTTAARDYFANDSDKEDFIVDANVVYTTSMKAVDSRTLFGAEFRDSSNDNECWWAAAPAIDWSNPVYSGGFDLGTLSPYAHSRTDTTGKALYAQQELTFNDRIIASLGLRHDWIKTEEHNKLTGLTQSDDYSETTARAGLTYKFNDSFALFGNYAQSVVPASVGLEPERGEQFEAGVKFRPAGTRALFTASVYNLTKENMTVTDPVTLTQRTIGEAEAIGIDLEAKADLTDAISLTAGYSYIETEIVENGTRGNEGNELSFVPNHSASLWLDYTLSGLGNLGDMTFGAGARYTGTGFMDDANTLTSEAAVVVDAAFDYEISEQTSLGIKATNIFDEKHVAYGGFGADFYNPGRNVKVTLRHSW